MDPDATLRKILDLISQFNEADDAGFYMSAMGHARELVEQLPKLDEWLRHGGTLPMDWHAAGRP